jgi:hypothetical protein
VHRLLGNVSPTAVDREIGATRQVTTAVTNCRSVLGSLNDFSRMHVRPAVAPVARASVAGAPSRSAQRNGSHAGGLLALGVDEEDIQ